MDGRSLARRVWAVSLPLLFVEVSETIVHVIDTLFLARVGTTELAAVAVGDTILEIWLVLAIGLTEGMQIVIARRAGQGKREAVGETFAHGVVLVTVVAVALTGALKLAAPRLVPALVGSAEVAAATEEFLGLAAYGIVFLSLSYAFSALFVGLARPRVLVAAAVVLAVTNGALGYLLIFGNLGFPRMGIRGAALASVGAEVVTAAFLAFHGWRRLARNGRRLFGWHRWDASLARSLLALSGPIALQALVEAVQWLGFFLVIERMGAGALAASNVIYACFAVFVIPAVAFGDAASSLVSNLFGRAQAERVRSLVRQATRSAYVVTAPFVAVGLLAPAALVAVFGPETVVGERAVDGIRVAAATMALLIPAELWLAAVVGTGDTGASFAIQVLLGSVMVSSAYLIGIALQLPVEWVWLSLAASGGAALASSWLWLRGGRWQSREL